MESSALHQLEQIPGVGKTIARNMLNIDINSIDDLNVHPIAKQLASNFFRFSSRTIYVPECTATCGIAIYVLESTPSGKLKLTFYPRQTKLLTKKVCKEKIESFV